MSGDSSTQVAVAYGLKVEWRECLGRLGGKLFNCWHAQAEVLEFLADLACWHGIVGSICDGNELSVGSF